MILAYNQQIDRLFGYEYRCITYALLRGEDCLLLDNAGKFERRYHAEPDSAPATNRTTSLDILYEKRNPLQSKEDA